MGFDARQEFRDVNMGPERVEKKPPCKHCKGWITILPPVQESCWACYAGWPRATRPVMNLHESPFYARALARIHAARAWRAAKRVAVIVARPDVA
jgi:hypothetical protein